jgi:hypothetical protein
MEDRDFDGVEAGSLTRNRCSPRVEEDASFRGLRLAAPARVVLGGAPEPFSSAFARMVVCGALHVDFAEARRRGGPLSHVLLVAVSATTHRAYAARLEAVPNPIADPDLGAPDPDGWPEGSIILYFNPNLAEALPLPEAEDAYLVYATLGAHVSNVVRTELRRPA